MTPALGVVLLYLAFLCALYSTVASVYGANKNRPEIIASARNASILTLPLLTGAALTLVRLLLDGVFQVEYVWSVSSHAMPTYLKVTALWGGQAGSLLFWSWLMSIFTAGAMLRNWDRHRNLMPYAISAMMGTLLFFMALVVFWENPFARVWAMPDGDTITALFGPSPFLSGLTDSYYNVVNRLPGLLGKTFQDAIPLAAPAGSFTFPIADGRGLNPLLRHIGMIIHPPMLYLGFVGFVVPYAFGMAALATGEIDPGWIRATRRWTLVAWMFLSLGLILGGRWAYDVLGWGGYWAWDPVENAAFLPWLSGTAFLHSVMVQEKRGMLRRWNMFLIILTYLQVIWGTFITRAGLISSVHSFAQSAIGPLFFVFVIAAFIISVSLLMQRWDVLKDDNRLDAIVSREAAFLLNNLLFLIINFIVFLGTHFPMLSELVMDEKVTVGPEWYNFILTPFFLALVLLMGIAPLIVWGKTTVDRLGTSMRAPLAVAGVLVGIRAILRLTGQPYRSSSEVYTWIAFIIIVIAGSLTLFEFHRAAMARGRSRGEFYPVAVWNLFGRNRRRYGGYLIHLGVVVMAIGVLGSNAFQQETQQTISAGQTITFEDYVLRYDSLERFVATDDRTVLRANMTVFKNGREMTTLSPRQDFYPDGQPMTIPGNLSQIDEDFYVLLVAWEDISLSNATFKIYINPLINWVWAGGLVFVIGTFVAAWPDLSEERRPIRQRAGITVAQSA